jgi:hypothetical protein
MIENNSGACREYNVQMMAQEAQAMDALQKVAQLEKAMEPDHPNGPSENPMPDLAVGHTQVYKNADTLSSNTNNVRKLGRI